MVLSYYRFIEKGNLEVQLFTIQSKMRANNQKVYTPREGKLVSDINKVRKKYLSDVHFFFFIKNILFANNISVLLMSCPSALTAFKKVIRSFEV